MKIIIILMTLTFIISSCSKEGESNPIVNAPNNDGIAVSTESDTDDSITEEENNPEDESATEIAAAPEVAPEVAPGIAEVKDDDIIDIVLDINEDELKNIDMINRVLDSEDFEPTMVGIEAFSKHYNIQRTNIHNIDDSPTFYLTAHKFDDGRAAKKAFDFIKLQDYGAIKTYYRGSLEENLGRVRTVFHKNDLPIIITNKPINIVTVDEVEKSVKKLTSLGEGNEVIASLGKDDSAVCGISRSETPLLFHYSFTSKVTMSDKPSSEILSIGKRSKVNLCSDDSIFFLSINDSSKKVYQYNFKSKLFSEVFTETQIDSKVYLISRDNQNFVRIYYPKNEERLKAFNTFYKIAESELVAINALPKLVRNPYQSLRVYTSTSQISLDNPVVDVLIKDRSQKIFNEDKLIQVADLPSSKANISNIQLVGDKLIALIQGKKIHEYNYNDDKFSSKGLTLPYGIKSILTKNNKKYIFTGGNNLFEWDESNEWTQSTLETITLKRDDSSLNPKLIHKFEDLNAKNVQAVQSDDENIIIRGNIIDNTQSFVLRFDPLIKEISERHETDTGQVITEIESIEQKILYTTRYNGDSFEESDSAQIVSLDGASLLPNHKSIPILNQKVVRGLKNHSERDYSFIAQGHLYHYDSISNKIESLQNYSGISYRKTITTPNKKLITINDGKVILVSPLTKSSEVLYEITDSNLVNFRKIALFDDKLIILDRNKNLHRIHLSYGKLNMFDEAQVVNND